MSQVAEATREMSQKRFTSDMVRTLGSSGIRRAFDLSASMKDPINFSIGQPDFPVPDVVKEAITRAVRENRNGYTPTRGLAELRERLTAKLKKEFDWNPDLFITSGVSGGLVLSLFACINPGDEVIFADPYFVSYPQLVKLARGTSVAVESYGRDFQLDPDRLAAAITPRSKMILLNSPSNPTGIVFREETIKAVAELARKHDLLIVSDEIYEPLCYDGRAVSPAKFAPERTVIIRGFGKSHAMTGLRIAYIAGPGEVITEMAKVQQYTYVCSPHPVQYGALAALDVDMSPQVDAYRAKRDLICKELGETFEFVRPSGGFYVFPKAPRRFATGTAFCEEALKREVIIIGGEVFSRRDTHFRISYAVPDEKIKAGCKILRELAAG